MPSGNGKVIQKLVAEAVQLDWRDKVGKVDYQNPEAGTILVSIRTTA